MSGSIRGSDATVITTLRRIPGPLGIAVSVRSDTTGARVEVYSHGDARGSRFFTDSLGYVIQETTYGLFGALTSNTGNLSSLSYTDDLWNGGDNFPEVGISILGDRAYDPEHGRFLQRDPIMNTWRAQTANPYSFAFNDPANLSDPSGMQPPHEDNPLSIPSEPCVMCTGGGSSDSRGDGIDPINLSGSKGVTVLGLGRPTAEVDEQRESEGNCEQGSGAGSFAPTQCSIAQTPPPPDYVFGVFADAFAEWVHDNWERKDNAREILRYCGASRDPVCKKAMAEAGDVLMEDMVGIGANRLIAVGAELRFGARLATNAVRLRASLRLEVALSRGRIRLPPGIKPELGATHPAVLDVAARRIYLGQAGADIHLTVATRFGLPLESNLVGGFVTFADDGSMVWRHGSGTFPADDMGNDDILRGLGAIVIW